MNWQGIVSYFYPQQPVLQARQVTAPNPERALENNVDCVSQSVFKSASEQPPALKRALKLREDVPTIFIQNNRSIPEVTKAVGKDGANWKTLVLDNVDDPLMGLIVEKCPHLTSLKIIISSKQNPGLFSGFGLQLIANLAHLESLDLNFIDQTRMGSGDFLTLLESFTLQLNIQDLSITSHLIGDAHLEPISKFSKLRQLSIGQGFYTAQGLMQLFQSSEIADTLQSINILGNTQLFNNECLEALSKLPKLKEVTLNGQWNTKDQDIVSLLKAKSEINVLGISGYPISQGVLEQVATMTGLKNLALGDCSGVTTFNSLAQNLKGLQVLLLDKAEHFTDSDFGYVAKWRNLHSLSLLGAAGLNVGFVFFCSSPFMTKNLKVFHLSGKNAICDSLVFGNLGKLGALETLRLENLSYFNSDSLLLIGEGIAAASLEALELNGVSIDNQAMGVLSSFVKLDTLMVANCRGLTRQAMQVFMNNNQMQGQLKRLYLEGVWFNDQLLSQFGQFEKMLILYLQNLRGVDVNNYTLRLLAQLPAFKENNTNVPLMDGTLVSFVEFQNGQD